MNRREFSISLTLAAALAPLAGRAADPDSQVAARARALYARALVLDCNSGPPTEDNLPMPKADLDIVRASGVTAVKWSLGGINSKFKDTVAEIAGIQRMIEVHPDYFMQVRVPADLERCKQERKLGLILSFESADMLGGKIETF